MRQKQLFILTNLYAVFCIWHLGFAAKGSLTTALLFGVPGLIIALILLGLVFCDGGRFTVLEKASVLCLVILILFFNGYMVLCKYSTPEWIWYHNVKTGIFIAITAVFNSYTLYQLKREYR